MRILNYKIPKPGGQDICVGTSFYNTLTYEFILASVLRPLHNSGML